MDNNFIIDTTHNVSIYTYAYSNNHPLTVKEQFKKLQSKEDRLEAIRDGETPRIREMRDAAKVHGVNYELLLPKEFFKNALFKHYSNEIYIYARKLIIAEYRDALDDFMDFVTTCNDLDYLQTFNLFHVSLFSMSDTNISTGSINGYTSKSISYKFHKRMVKLIGLAEGEQVCSVDKKIIEERILYAKLTHATGDVRILERLIERQEEFERRKKQTNDFNARLSVLASTI